MFEVVWRMLRRRRGQAVALTLLATLCVAAAVVLPVFTGAADRAITAAAARAATPQQLLVATSKGYSAKANATGYLPSDSQYTRAVEPLLLDAGLHPVAAATTDVYLTGVKQFDAYPRLLFREDACDHVVLESGRCALTSGEVMLTAAYAADLGVDVGATVPMRWAHYTAEDGWTPDGVPVDVSIVGIYDPADPGEVYWGSTPFYDFDATRVINAPVLTGAATFERLPALGGERYIDGLLDVSKVTPDRLAAIRTTVGTVVTRAQGDGAVAGSQIPALLDRIARERSTVRSIVPLFALPLIVLGWFVIFLATSYAVSARRGELGIIAMRGTGRARRWWLAAGESLTSVLLGVPLGILAGAAVAWAIGRIAWPVDVPAGTLVPSFWSVSAEYVLVVALGAVVAVALAVRRPLRTSTVELLRATARPEPVWRSIAFDAVVVALAASAMFQLVVGHGALRGVQLAAPPLVIAAVGLVTARVIAPLASFAAGRILRGGRKRRGPRVVGLAIGALQLARRPGAVRLYTILVVTVGISAFTVVDGSVADAVTVDRARLDLGAPRVLSTLPITRYQLLKAVRAADPDGIWAMAAVSVPVQGPTDLPILAVDASRLGAVAQWPSGGLNVTEAAAKLAPAPATPPLMFTAYSVAFDLSVDPTLYAAAVTGYNPPPEVFLEIEDADGLDHDFVTGLSTGGRQTINFEIPYCGRGCRLVSVGVDQQQEGFQQSPLKYVAHSLSVVTPTPALITDFHTAFHAPKYLKTDNVAAIGPYADGLPVDVSSPGTSAGGGVLLGAIAPSDAAYPIPALSTGPLVHAFQGKIGDAPVPLVRVGAAPELPRLGGRGILVDLGVLDSAAPSTGDGATSPEVWLGPRTPNDALDRLAAAGLQINRDRTYQEVLADLRGEGPAVSRHVQLFALFGMGALALLGALVSAAVDRRRRAAELSALRVQGVGRRAVSVAALTGYVGLAIAATVVGVASGVAVWHYGRLHVPVFTDGSDLVAVPAWPDPGPLAGAVGAIAALLLVLMLTAAWDLRREVARGAGARGARLRNRPAGVPD